MIYSPERITEKTAMAVLIMACNVYQCHYSHFAKNNVELYSKRALQTFTRVLDIHYRFFS